MKLDITFKTTLLPLVVALSIFFSYYAISPMGSGYYPLNSYDYSLITQDVNKGNQWATFKDEKQGHFFIHTGDKQAITGLLTFYRKGNVKLNFSLKNESEQGNIAFTINHNQIPLKTFFISEKQNETLILPVNINDTITVIADKNGVTNQDRGNLQLTLREPSFLLQTLLVPLLWLFLFLMLYPKHYGLAVISAYFVFLYFMIAEYLHFGALDLNTILNYTVLSMSLVFILATLRQMPWIQQFKLPFILTLIFASVLLTLPLLFIIYGLNSGVPISKEIIFAVFQTHFDESIDYLIDFVNFRWFLFFIISFFMLGFLLWKQQQKKTIPFDGVLLRFITVIFVSISLVTLPTLRLPHFLLNNSYTYQHELRLFRTIQAQRKTGNAYFKAEKTTTGETYLIVIGEALNKHHMGLYGYFRPTTPHLSRLHKENDLLVFQNVYSNHTHTNTALSLALTEANQINQKSYYESLSIINILNQADIETYWVSNQSLKGVYDNMVSALATEANHLVGINHAIGAQWGVQQHDGDLVNKVEKILDQTSDKNRVIFVHLAGNHFNYCDKFPKGYQLYTGVLAQAEFGQLAQAKGLNSSLNCYDNSVLYNDAVVSNLLEVLKQQQGRTGFVYLPDHSEDVLGGRGHESSLFTHAMAEIPMLAWFSNAFKTHYTKKYTTFKSHLNTLYSNDFLYDTLLGLMDVKTDKYQAVFDLSSLDYNLDENSALTLHGAKLHTEKNNYIWWQRKNSQYLLESQQANRVFPHRVNSTGKLNQIWQEGFRSFELDVYFDDNKFQIGHNQGDMGDNFTHFLAQIDATKIKRIWFDFKNLSLENQKPVLARLEYLDKKFALKEKLLIESSQTTTALKALKIAGWNTSYYLPTVKIIGLLRKQDNTQLRQLATQISQQSVIQNLSAISFDNQLYPFVKQYLEPIISDNINYHTWWGPDLYTPEFQNELKTNNLFLNPRIKTLLVRYISPYNL